MSHTQIWIHAVWSTKRRAPLLSDKFRSEIFNHMIHNGRLKGIEIDRINGFVDHVHMLFRLRPTQTIAEILNQVKGESSRWINKHQMSEGPFEWQTDYFASAVCANQLKRTRTYIDNQARHHEI